MQKLLKNIKIIKNKKFKINNVIIVNDLYLIINQFNLSEDILDIIITYLGRCTYSNYFNNYVLSQILNIQNNSYTKIGIYKNLLCSFCIQYGNVPRIDIFRNIGNYYTHPLCWNCENNFYSCSKKYYISKNELKIIKVYNLYNLIMNELTNLFNKKNINYNKTYNKNYFIN